MAGGFLQIPQIKPRFHDKTCTVCAAFPYRLVFCGLVLKTHARSDSNHVGLGKTGNDAKVRAEAVCFSFTLFSSLSAMDTGEYSKRKYFYFSTNKRKLENSRRCKMSTFSVGGGYLENS